VLAIPLARRFVPGTRGDPAQRGADVLGAISITGGVALLIYTIVRTQTVGWGATSTIILGVVSIAMIVSFVVIESRVAAPLVRLGIFRVRALAGGDSAMFFLAAGMFANFYFGTLYLQEILRYSPISTGLAFLPVALLIGVGAGISQRIVPRFGIRVVAIGGVTVGAVGLALMARVGLHSTYAGTLLPAYVLLALGLGFAFVPATLIGVSSVGAEDAGLASGLFNTAQQIGGALGLAILATIAATRTSDRLAAFGNHVTTLEGHTAQVAGYHVAFLAAAGLMLLADVVLVVFVRARHVAHVAVEGAGGLAAVGSA
jgi:predicted MFS family arabinose efflux permease